MNTGEQTAGRLRQVMCHETRRASDHRSWSESVNTGDQIAGRLCQAMRRHIAVSV